MNQLDSITDYLSARYELFCDKTKPLTIEDFNAEKCGYASVMLEFADKIDSIWHAERFADELLEIASSALSMVGDKPKSFDAHYAGVRAAALAIKDFFNQ